METRGRVKGKGMGYRDLLLLIGLVVGACACCVVVGVGVGGKMFRVLGMRGRWEERGERKGAEREEWGNDVV
jgi:hypothetical protein